MTTEDDFEKLFGGSILESLEGALNDISLQMQSSSSDLKMNATEDGDVLSVDSDYSSYHDDDGFTTETNDTGFSYVSDEEEDPETGEQDLFAMMDSLVAELESEMEFFVEKSDEPEKLPALPNDNNQEEEEEEEENKETGPNPDNVESHSHPQASKDEIAGFDSTTQVGSSHDPNNKNQSAKSLFKVLSVLAKSDDPTSGIGSDTGGGHLVEGTKNIGTQYPGASEGAAKNAEPLSDGSSPSENAMKLDTETTPPRANYVPTEADCKHFVGVLADYSRRRNRARAQDRSDSSVAKKTETLREEAAVGDLAGQTDNILETKPSNSEALSKPNDDSRLMPVDNNELPHSQKKENEVVQDQQREKTSRATMANFTLKKRREYMQRKRQSKNAEAVALAESTPAPVTTVKKESADSNNLGPRKETIDDTSAANVRRATPSKRRKKKKKQRRTNKHRKGRPKRQTGTSPKDLQPTDGLSGTLPPGSLPAATRQYHHHHTPAPNNNNGYDSRAREEVIRALAQTDLWRWLVTQVHENKNNNV